MVQKPIEQLPLHGRQIAVHWYRSRAKSWLGHRVHGKGGNAGINKMCGLLVDLAALVGSNPFAGSLRSPRHNSLSSLLAAGFFCQACGVPGGGMIFVGSSCIFGTVASAIVSN
jgi:hypothetical protein